MKNLFLLIQKKRVKDKLDPEKIFSLIKETCTSKMDESIDVSLKINTKQKNNSCNRKNKLLLE